MKQTGPSTPNEAMVKLLVTLNGKKNGTFTVKHTQKLPLIQNISLHWENSFPCLVLIFSHLRIAFQIHTDALKIQTRQKILFIEQR